MDARRIVRLTAAAAVLTGTVLVGGCDEDNNELQRLVCEVQSINGGLPLVAGYLDAGQDKIAGTPDDVLPIDSVPVVFHARPYNSAITLPDDAPFSHFHVTGYDLVWVPLSPGSEPLADFQIIGGGCDILVPVGQEATVYVMVADRYLKEQPFYPRSMNDLVLSARGLLTFYGHETGSDEETVVRGSFMANFVGVVVDN